MRGKGYNCIYKHKTKILEKHRNYVMLNSTFTSVNLMVKQGNVSYKLTRLDLASWLWKFFRHRRGLHPTHSHSPALSYNTGDATSFQMAQLQLIPHFLTVVIDQIWIITLVKLQKPNRSHAKFHQGSVINFYHFPISVTQVPKYVLVLWTRGKQQFSYKVTCMLVNDPLSLPEIV